MTYVLYGEFGSGAAAVDLALAEIGAEVEWRAVPLVTHAQRAEAFAAVNPGRKVPALVTPEGETLTESAAILVTLSERHPEAALLPAAGSSDRARALRWLVFMAAEIYPIIEMEDYPERFQPEGEALPADRREALAEHARTIWKRRWRVVEAAVSGAPWLLESGFGAVDVYAAVLSRWAQTGDWRPAHIPRIEAIAAAVAARPRCAPVWARHFPPGSV